MRYGSLFSGIGGIDLGLDRAGMTCAWQVERDPYCQRVLAKHWPDVKRYDDIREVDFTNAPAVDLLAGGFPCQPHSLAGRRGASSDERDLWGEFARAIRHTKPRWVVAENVPGLLTSEKGEYFGRLLGSLAELGYDAEWEVIPAGAFGAPHARPRLLLVAYPGDYRCEGGQERHTSYDQPIIFSEAWDYVDGLAVAQHRVKAAAGAVRRMDDGLPTRTHRLRVLGNSVVPQVSEWVGARIMEVSKRDYICS